MKHEYAKHEKEFYAPSDEPTFLTVPKMKFFCVKGTGDPNGPDFAERINVLYSLAYAVRMMPQNGFVPPDYFEYTVYPLEGLWDLSEEGRLKTHLDKGELVYTIMIRQPEFVDRAIADRAFAIAAKKKPHPLLREAYFDAIEDGPSVQIMHHGPYDLESASFVRMQAFLEARQLSRGTMIHREIYLTDARKTEPDKMKTILRYMVK